MATERAPAALVTSPSETIQADPFNSSYSNVPRTARIDSTNLGPSAALSSTSSDKLEVHETSSLQPLRSNSGQPIQFSARRPSDPRSERRETKTNEDEKFPDDRNAIDWIVPKDANRGAGRTVADRLQPTLDHAIIEKDKSSAKAKLMGWTLNIAIGLQVLFGSLTTGLSALAVSGEKSTAKATTALGALATLVASYLARARGSNEPEVSIARAKNLDQFIRECRAFQMDHGHVTGNEFDEDLIGFRHRLEELLGNVNGERKQPSV